MPEVVPPPLTLSTNRLSHTFETPAPICIHTMSSDSPDTTTAKKAKAMSATENSSNNNNNISAMHGSAELQFRVNFPGCIPSVATFAPGRVNLVGEHTDYSEGFVFPVAIQLGTVCVACKLPNKNNSKSIIRAYSMQKPSDGIIEFAVGDKSTSPWGIFLAGVAAQHPGGLSFCVNVVFCSDVPLGGGLSSSASLDVAFAMALEQLDKPGHHWDGVARALRCVEGDHTYPGVPCGIMDQFISSNAVAKSALLIDCRTSTFEVVPFDDPALAIIVANTNKVHSHATGEYKTLVRHCQEASKFLNVPFLRDVKDLSVVETIPDPMVKRRARHVVTEIARCLKAADCMFLLRFNVIHELTLRFYYLILKITVCKKREWKQFGEIVTQWYANPDAYSSAL